MLSEVRIGTLQRFQDEGGCMKNNRACKFCLERIEGTPIYYYNYIHVKGREADYSGMSFSCKACDEKRKENINYMVGGII
jgi:hypothetical protein